MLTAAPEFQSVSNNSISSSGSGSISSSGSGLVLVLVLVLILSIQGVYKMWLLHRLISHRFHYKEIMTIIILQHNGASSFVHLLLLLVRPTMTRQMKREKYRMQHPEFHRKIILDRAVRFLIFLYRPLLLHGVLLFFLALACLLHQARFFSSFVIASTTSGDRIFTNRFNIYYIYINDIDIVYIV
ncbi:hypothetical protein RND71_038911 [Anisodus tanguticus]|uniref:Uncharacterized protein n=1 Tax=Anisodus tanguticus TaxID=243964 RepID=A0AAE1R0M9_9SOLA|nr:hypothetical protein RND71_038911 [Anisodus tanguticus]